MKFGYNWPSSFRGEVVWNCWRTTTEPAYTISSPGAFGSGELKSNFFQKRRTLFFVKVFVFQWANWKIVVPLCNGDIHICLNPTVLRMAKTLLSFGHSENNGVKETFSCFSIKSHSDPSNQSDYSKGWDGLNKGWQTIFIMTFSKNLYTSTLAGALEIALDYSDPTTHSYRNCFLNSWCNYKESIISLQMYLQEKKWKNTSIGCHFLFSQFKNTYNPEVHLLVVTQPEFNMIIKTGETFFWMINF